MRNEVSTKDRKSNKEVKVKARFVKTAPRKIRLVCDLIRGRRLIEAKNLLFNLKKQAAFDLLSLLDEAIAQAKEKDLKIENLYIKKIKADEGPVFKRYIFRSRGRADMVKKRMSHIKLVLGEQAKIKNKNEKRKIKF